MQNSKHWTNIFTLLAAVILVDDAVEGVELECFTNAVAEMTVTLGFDSFVPVADIEDWFTRNKAYLRDLINSPVAEIRFTDIILSLTDFPHVGLVFRQMQRVSLSNLSLDESEFDLIILASALWGLHPSRQFTSARPKVA